MFPVDNCFFLFLFWKNFTDLILIFLFFFLLFDNYNLFCFVYFITHIEWIMNRETAKQQSLVSSISTLTTTTKTIIVFRMLSFILKIHPVYTFSHIHYCVKQNNNKNVYDCIWFESKLIRILVDDEFCLLNWMNEWMNDEFLSGSKTFIPRKQESERKIYVCSRWKTTKNYYYYSF